MPAAADFVLTIASTGRTFDLALNGRGFLVTNADPTSTGDWRYTRDGALFGNTAEEAFYVRIDEVLNPFSEQALGRLHIEIGVRPSYPAEFIIVRIGIWQGGAEVEEA